MTHVEPCCVCNKDVLWEDIVWAEGDKAFCPDCADDPENLIECEYCGQLRFPENLCEYEDTHYKSEWNGKKMCIGCIDDASDDDYMKRCRDD